MSEFTLIEQEPTQGQEHAVDQGTTIGREGCDITLGDPDCLFSDARTLIARVSPIGSDRNGRTYVLERVGSF